MDSFNVWIVELEKIHPLLAGFLFATFFVGGNCAVWFIVFHDMILHPEKFGHLIDREN